MKKFVAFLLAVALMLPMLISAAAAEVTMSEGEFTDAVAEILKDYYANPDTAIQKLEEIGAYLEGEPVLITHNSSENENARGTGFQDYSFYVTCIRRSNSTLRYLQWHLTANAREWFPGPYDLVSLEWDTAYADYYDSYGDGVYTSIAGRQAGIVLFNLDDSELKKGDYCYGTVRVDPVQNGTMEFGSKFTHIYTSINLGGSANWGFSPSAQLASNGIATLGFSYTFGYSVTVGTGAEQWSLWTDNAVTFSNIVS